MSRNASRRRHWKVRVKWEPRDLWIGLYWTRILGHAPSADGMAFYICLVPCLPIKVSFNYGFKGFVDRLDSLEGSGPYGC